MKKFPCLLLLVLLLTGCRSYPLFESFEHWSNEGSNFTVEGIHSIDRITLTFHPSNHGNKSPGSSQIVWEIVADNPKSEEYFKFRVFEVPPGFQLSPSQTGSLPTDGFYTLTAADYPNLYKILAPKTVQEWKTSAAAPPPSKK